MTEPASSVPASIQSIV